MKAVVMAIGSELLQGFLVDTNSGFLAQALATLGVEVVGIRAVGDSLPMIVTAFNRSLEDADIVVCTGGIGPTADDLSREAVAEVCGETPTVDPDVLKTVESFFLRRGATMPARNAKQAWTIPSAEVLSNPMGTAPGWFVRVGEKAIVLMPGVPREMMPMWEHEAVPRIRPMLDSDVIVSETLKTIGIGESAVEEQLRDIIDRGDPVVSTYAKNDGVHVRILATGTNSAEAASEVQRVEQEVRSVLGRHVYGTLELALPVAVLQPLIHNPAKIVIVEVGTAGQVAALLMSDPGVSHVIAECRAYPKQPHERSLETESLHSRVEAAMTSNNVENGIGVAVTTSGQDEQGRFDATIEVVVRVGQDERVESFSFAAREIELGRRASLLAAEVLRNALLDSTGARSD